VRHKNQASESTCAVDIFTAQLLRRTSVVSLITVTRFSNIDILISLCSKIVVWVFYRATLLQSAVCVR